ncbi:MAG: hypothetical protein JEY79_01840 [Pseudodesulfovibrio sp.]|nr:hypothetical protein [Pseudodesulfovibrio sp.]
MGGLVAIIWLMVLGEWGTLGYGLLYVAGSTFLIGFALMPGMLLAVPALWALEKGKKMLGIIFGLIPTTYTYALMIAWAAFSFVTFMKRADNESYIPVLLLSYMVAAGPWAYMASKEDNPYSGISSVFCSFSYILVMIAVYFFRPTAIELIELFSAPLIFALFFTTYLSYRVDKEEEELYGP